MNNDALIMLTIGGTIGYALKYIFAKNALDNINKSHSEKLKEINKVSDEKIKKSEAFFRNEANYRKSELEKAFNKKEEEIRDEWVLFRKEKGKLIVESQNLQIRKNQLERVEGHLIDLKNNELNDTMISIYNECFENNLNEIKSFFETKKNPSKKASEFVSEFKEYIKEIEVDNRKLRLALSQYVDGIEGYNEVIKQRRLDGLKEYNNLSKTEKQELKLSREKEKQKNQLEIGFAFERYYGYMLEQEGYKVDYHGIKNGVSDGGIDLVAKDKNKTVYIQCKYWSKRNQIRENTVSQLYGASLNMALQNGSTIEGFNEDVKKGKVKMVLATHTVLSDEAKAFAERLGVEFVENLELQEYPMVKLVEGEDKIYYIPSDEQYDTIIFSSTSKKYSRCNTCAEAEELGYRSAKRWLGYL